MRDVSRSRPARIGLGTWAVGLILVVGVLALSARTGRRPGARVAPPASVPAQAAPLLVGDVAKLSLPGASGVWIALEESSWDAMLDAENQGARGGPGAGSAIFRLAEAKKIRKFPVGTRVRILANCLTSRQVEILGDEAGTSGWVQAEFVGR